MSFLKSVEYYFDKAFQLATDYYLVVCTIFFVLVMTFVLPDLVNKLNSNKEFKSIKKIVKQVSKEVSRAEVACLTAAGDICYLHCSMHDGATETEVAIMSYVYTNSFDALKPNSTDTVTS